MGTEKLLTKFTDKYMLICLTIKSHKGHENSKNNKDALLVYKSKSVKTISSYL